MALKNPSAGMSDVITTFSNVNEMRGEEPHCQINKF